MTWGINVLKPPTPRCFKGTARKATLALGTARCFDCAQHDSMAEMAGMVEKSGGQGEKKG
jgi:hypothetical protein